MASIEQIDVDKVLVGLKRAAATAENEEELRIRDSGILQSEVISKLGIPSPRHEKYTFVTGGRIDALYGHVVIEYKAPGKLLREPDIAKAKEQLIGYIKEEAEVEDRFKLFLGVVLADRIGFVRYDEKSKSWLLRGPYDLNRETVLRLVEAIRGLRRKKLAVDELLKDFGPKSDMAVSMVNVFYGKVVGSKSPKVEALFNDWKRLFSQVCAYSPEKLRGLEAEYGLSGKVDYSALLFAVHTYYALVMKLLAAEVAYLFGAGKWLKSYVAELEDANMKGLDAFKRALEDLESGGVFRKFLNITNFIEGDYFSWYLEELDQETADKIADLAKRLADYEPATPVLEPEYTRDLLKRLYQNLVPRNIRRRLGEFYTPDWLAELLLDEAGLTVENFEKIAQNKNDLTVPLDLRILDPACGSGTFLVLTMKRFREYAEGHYLKDVLINYLLKNVVGFDLNPLAVLTARTNYLLAIADMFGYAKGSIEIPIYLSDSLLVETRTTLTGVSYVIRTHVGVFELPKSIVDKGILGKLLEVIDRFVRLRYKTAEFRHVAKEELDLNDEELRLVGNLYENFLQLEQEGKNHVWTSIIKNAFAPLTLVSSYGKFDYVVGNPPWINWENLPEDYRISSRDLWSVYGLLKVVRIGGFKREIAALFVIRCLDRFVENGGKLAFLVPFTIFKNQPGAGFREILAKGKPSNKLMCKVLKVHDLVTLFPFEGAVNRTAMIIVEKTAKTEFPFPCIIWHNPKSGGIDPELSLDEVKGVTSKFEMTFRPLLENRPESPWMQTTARAYQGVSKMLTSMESRYEAHNGVYTGLNQAYWIKVIEETPDGLLISNPPIPGAKKSIRQVEDIIERNLVHPFIRGRDIQKWYVGNEFGWIIIPHSKDGRPLNEREMKLKYPKTYEYFRNFETELKKRTIKPFLGSGLKIPFYRLDNIGPYTFDKYKVVWKPIAGAITGKATSFASAVLEPSGNTIYIPDHSVMFLSFKSENESYYISGILNSSIFLFLVASSTYEISGYGHVIRYVNISEFDPTNSAHKKLVETSKKAHEIALKIYQDGQKELKSELKRVEEEIDGLVAQLYEISDEELKEIRTCLEILKGKDVEEEFIEEESMEATVDFLNAVASPNIAGSFEVAIANPSKETVEIELQLPDRKVRLETDKEQETIRVKTPPLPKGEHKIPYKIIVQDRVAKGEFTLHVKEKKKFRKEESLTGKLDELLGEG